MLKAVYILLFIGVATSDSSVTSVIARILDQAKRSKSRSPIILVVNSRAQESSSSVEALPLPLRQSEETGLQNGISLFSVLAQLQKPRPTEYARPRPQPRKPQKLPVYKSLLSLRNSLRCGARDECIDECSEIPKKKEQKKCDRKCEKKYECQEEPEEPECGNDDCDDNPSTKGPAASEEKPRGCSRC